MTKLINRILESRMAIAFFKVTRSIKPWGFEGLSLYAVARFFIEGIQKGALATRAAAISFRIFLAIFPVIILLMTLIPIIPIENFQQDLFDSIRAFFPGDTFSLFETTVNELINKTHNTVFSIGFILSLYYASNSVNAILQGFNGSYNLNRKGNPLIIRLISVLLLLILGLLIFIAVALIIFSGVALEKLIEMEVLTEGAAFSVTIAKWIFTFLLVYGSISLLYNFGDLKNTKWRTFSAGVTFSTLLFIITSLGFAWFVNNLATYNKLYGTLGSVLLLMIWVNVNNMILLLGFELNTSIQRAKMNLQAHDENYIDV
jgi:membrane protein